MLATHNTLTFLEPKFKVFNLFKFLWKCQDNQAALYDADYADIRIRKKKNGKFVVCHGYVDFKLEFNNIVHLINWINTSIVLCRVIFERGNALEEDISILKACNKIHQIIIKKGWKILYTSYDITMQCWNYEYWEKEISFKENINKIRNRGLYTIKSYAKKVNKDLPIDHKDVYYMIDYYRPNYYKNA